MGRGGLTAWWVDFVLWKSILLVIDHCEIFHLWANSNRSSVDEEDGRLFDRVRSDFADI